MVRIVGVGSGEVFLVVGFLGQGAEGDECEEQGCDKRRVFHEM
jgi:hypothetical protein